MLVVVTISVCGREKRHRMRAAGSGEAQPAAATASPARFTRTAPGRAARAGSCKCLPGRTEAPASEPAAKRRKAPRGPRLVCAFADGFVRARGQSAFRVARPATATAYSPSPAEAPRRVHGDDAHVVEACRLEPTDVVGAAWRSRPRVCEPAGPVRPRRREWPGHRCHAPRTQYAVRFARWPARGRANTRCCRTTRSGRTRRPGTEGPRRRPAPCGRPRASASPARGAAGQGSGRASSRARRPRAR